MVDQYFKFNEIDWKLLVDNSKQEMIGKKECIKLTTDFGKPLLQVCIDADQGEVWVLKELMSNILDEFECDPNVNDYFGDYTLLQCSLFRAYSRQSGFRSQ